MTSAPSPVLWRRRSRTEKRAPAMSDAIAEAATDAQAAAEATWFIVRDALRKRPAVDIPVLVTVAEQLGRLRIRLRSLPSGDASVDDSTELASLRDGIAANLGNDALPKVTRRSLSDLYATLIELDIALTTSAPTIVPVAPMPNGVVRTPLILSTATLYQLRHTLFPAERMAVGAVRHDDDSRRLEAVFDVTGIATPAHVDADQLKLTRAFIAADVTSTRYEFWAHSQPGSGPSATLPSIEDRATFQRRLQDGDSRGMIAAIFADCYIRFFRADSDCTLIDAGSMVALQGSGIERVHQREALYAFTN